jgi:TfoX/Sxy family transcriptional regulator of competence genes
MAVDEKLAGRVRALLGCAGGVTEKKMFGGLCFLVNGNMALGLVNDDLMIRTDPASYEKWLALPHVRKMDFTGKPLKGFLYIGKGATTLDRDLRAWVSRGIEFGSSLPSKGSK